MFPFPDTDKSYPSCLTLFRKTHVNINGPSTSRFSNRSLSLSFPRKNTVVTSLVPHTCHMLRTSHSSLFDQPDSLTNIMKSWCGAEYHSHEQPSSTVPELAQDRAKWQAIFRIVLKFWVLSMAENILTTWKSTGSSSLAALHVVNLSSGALYWMTSAFCPVQRPLLHALNKKWSRSR
jgi:hypothetical protein